MFLNGATRSRYIKNFTPTPPTPQTDADETRFFLYDRVAVNRRNTENLGNRRTGSAEERGGFL